MLIINNHAFNRQDAHDQWTLRMESYQELPKTEAHLQCVLSHWWTFFLTLSCLCPLWFLPGQGSFVNYSVFPNKEWQIHLFFILFFIFTYFLAHNCLIGAWTSSFYADREMPSVMKLSTHQRENDPQQPLPSGTLCLLNVFCLFLLTMDHVGICSNNLTLEPGHSAFCNMLSTQHGSHGFGFSSEPQSFPVPAPAQAAMWHKQR